MTRAVLVSLFVLGMGLVLYAQRGVPGRASMPAVTIAARPPHMLPNAVACSSASPMAVMVITSASALVIGAPPPCIGGI